MPLEPIVGQDPPQVGVAVEDHAVHVEHFALEPAGDRPQRGHGRHRGILGRAHLDHHAVVLREREQHVDHLEALGALRVVGPGDLHQLLVVVRVAQQPQRILDALALHAEHDLAVLFLAGEQHLAERRAERLPHAFVRSEARGGMQDSGHIIAIPSPLNGPFAADLPLQLHHAVEQRPRRSGGSRARRCRPARCGRTRAPPSSCSDSSRRRWRTSPC